MSGEIQIKRLNEQKLRRPSWVHHRPTNQEYPGDGSATVEMLESCRNVLESIHQSQMLQYDVAGAIKDMAKTLRKIDRRLAKMEGMKLP